MCLESDGKKKITVHIQAQNLAAHACLRPGFHHYSSSAYVSIHTDLALAYLVTLHERSILSLRDAGNPPTM